jgi:succinoglycan biosynthesis transport protein ExoP
MDMADTAYPVEMGMPSPAGSGGPDVKLLLRRLLRGLPVILILTAFGTVAGYWLFKNLPHQYSTSVSILLDPKQPNTYGPQTQFGDALVDNSKISSVELILQSTQLLKEVADKLHMAENPLYGGAHPSRLGQILHWLTGRPVQPVADTYADREDRAIGRLWQMVHPSRIGITYVMRLDVTGPDPVDTARIAQSIAETYIDDMHNAEQEAGRRDASWLSDRLKAQRDELIKSETAVAAIQQKFGLVTGNAKDDTTVDRQSVDGLNQELIAVQGDIASVQSRYEAAVQLERSGGSLEALPDVASSPLIQGLRARQSDASEKLATLLTRYSSDYPAVKQAQKSVNTLTALIGQETHRIVQGIKTQYTSALARKAALTAEMTRLVQRMNATTSAEGREELREAERVAEANRVAYEASLSKLREVQQQETRLDVEARIISGPDVPDAPSFPRAIQILPAGALLGALLGAGLVLLRFGKPKIETVVEAEQSLALAVLGTLPLVPPAKLKSKTGPISVPDYLTHDPFSTFAESIRLLRFRLGAQANAGGRVILVTSSVPGEGKSTVAASLAISAATGHVRTVLVDLDLHRPAASRLLGNESSVGVGEYLLGQNEADDAIRENATLQVSSVTAGAPTTLRPGMVESRQLATLLSRLRKEYDVIIIDTPPVLALSDAVFISALADVAVMVVAWRATPRELVCQAVELLRSANAPLAGVLINKVAIAGSLMYHPERYGYRGGMLQTAIDAS